MNDRQRLIKDRTNREASLIRIDGLHTERVSDDR